MVVLIKRRPAELLVLRPKCTRLRTRETQISVMDIHNDKSLVRHALREGKRFTNHCNGLSSPIIVGMNSDTVG